MGELVYIINITFKLGSVNVQIFIKIPSCRIRGLSRQYPAVYYEKETFIEDTRNAVHRTVTPQSPPK